MAALSQYGSLLALPFLGSAMTMDSARKVMSLELVTYCSGS